MLLCCKRGSGRGAAACLAGGGLEAVEEVLEIDQHLLLHRRRDTHRLRDAFEMLAGGGAERQFDLVVLLRDLIARLELMLDPKEPA